MLQRLYFGFEKITLVNCGKLIGQKQENKQGGNAIFQPRDDVVWRRSYSSLERPRLNQ